MVRLPLLIGARPILLVNRKGPLVPLGSGDWLIISNHKDSQIFINCVSDGKSVSRSINGIPVIINVPKNILFIAQVELVKIGTESSLDIYAECK